MTEKQRRGRRNRRRGQIHECEVEQSIIERGGIAEKSREYHRAKAWDVHAHLNGMDLKIQCKWRKRLALFSEIHESISKGNTNVWCVKANRIGSYAVLPWNDYLELIRRTDA